MKKLPSSNSAGATQKRRLSWQPRNKVEVSKVDRATSQTILKGRVRREKKAVSIRMAVVRNPVDLIPRDLPTRADRRVREADPAAAPVILQTTRRRPARRERKVANNPTPVNSAFRVVRAGPAPCGPALFKSELCARSGRAPSSPAGGLARLRDRLSVVIPTHCRD